MKSFSASLIFREMRFKIMSCHYIATRMAKPRRLTVPNVGLDAERPVPSLIAWENENVTATPGNSLEVL